MAPINSQQLEQQLHTATDPREQIDLLNALTSQVRFDDLDLAWRYNVQALELCQRLNKAYEQGLADCYYWKGKLFAIEQKYHDALEALYQALDICQIIPPHKQSDYLQARRCLYPDSPDQFLEIGATPPVLHNIIGITLTYLEQFDDALLHYLSAWRLAEAENNPWVLLLLCNNVGFMYRRMEQPYEAQPYLQQGLEMVDQFPTTQAQQRIKATLYDKICWVSLHLGDLERAFEYGYASLQIYQHLNWPIGQAEILCRLGNLHLMQGNSTKALETLEQAYEFANITKLYQEMMSARLQQAQIYMQLKQYSQALDYVQQALGYSVYSQRETCKSHQLLSEIYEIDQQWELALNHYKIFHALREQIFTSKSDQRLKALNIIHRVEQAQAQAHRYYAKTKTLQQELEQHKQMQADLQYQAQTDPLTEVYNRRYFFEYAQREWEKAVRYHRPLSVLIMDLDFFKLVNDTYGHTVGDQLLFQFANLIQAHIRVIDVFGRYGGEEFTLLLPETNLDEAALIAERLRNLVANHQFKIEQLNIHITISIGAADKASPPDECFEDMLQRADDVLLKAKKFGRNQVHLAIPKIPH